MQKPRWTLGQALLAFPVGALAYDRFVPMRYCGWAPFDTQHADAAQAAHVFLRCCPRRFDPDGLQKGQTFTEGATSFGRLGVVAVTECPPGSRPCCGSCSTVRRSG